MKLIHCADLHFGAKIDCFPKEIAAMRKQEQRSSFVRMVEFAVQNGVYAVLLCGDVFDRDDPFKKDVDFFYDVIESHPQVNFFYLRGNHDRCGGGKKLPNLFTFFEDWAYYECGDVTVCGIELSSANERSYASTLSLAAHRKNIVMLHGQVGAEINLLSLRDKGVDYLALGHLHSYASGALDGRGTYAYSGCLEGRGFDETGEKGFVLLEVGERISHRFIPFSLRTIELVQVDVTGFREGYLMAKRARERTAFSRDTIYRVELVGEVDATVEEFAEDVEGYLRNDCLFVSVKDCTKRKIDYAAYENDASVYGEFVRTVRESEAFTDEEKAQIVAYGLRALAGREVDV